MLMRRLSLVASLLIAGPLCGCGPIFYAQLEEPELCKTVSADFQAAPVSVSGRQSVAIDLDLRSELESFHRPDTSTQLKLEYVRFEAVRGISNFAFVDTATVNVQGTTSAECNLPALVDYRRDPSASPQSTLTFTGPNLLDLTACLSAEKVTLKTEFAGSLPSNDWSMTVKTCLSGKARINYLGGK
jgi:hypothetical protein